MKAMILNETQQDFEMAEGPDGVAGLPTSAKIENKTAVGGEHSPELGCVADEPVNVTVLIDVAVLLLEVQGIRR